VNASGAIKENTLEEDRFVTKENAIKEGIVKAKPHALKLPLQFGEEVLGMATLVEISQYVFLGISETIRGTPIIVLLISNPPVLIVLGALLGIDQDTVGFTDAFEAFFGARVVGVSVRMGLQSEFPVGFLDFFRRGVGSDTQGLIVIVLRHYYPFPFNEWETPYSLSALIPVSVDNERERA
jgi:hypothetical protein